MSAPRDQVAAATVPDAHAERSISPRIAHVALWTRDLERLERLREFYERHFGARASAPYRSARRPGFVSYFVSFASGAQLELMTLPSDVATEAPHARAAADEPRCGYAHIALSLGSAGSVDALTARLAAAGVPVLSAPRWTGDGFYESVVADPDGNVVELTA
ncbi:MAG TPA: VOC family protein [Gemmatimonadaceae bacterium]|nr:VOC family protein [Gemmatimonadaceae bacterium]